MCPEFCKINSVKIKSILKYFPELKFLLRLWSAVRSLGKIPFVDLAFQLSACQLWIKPEFLARYFFRQNNFSSLLFTAWYSSHCFVSNCSLWCENTPVLSCAEALLQSYREKRLGLQGCACDSINPLVYLWLNKSHGVFQGNAAWKLRSSKLHTFLPIDS